MNGWIGTWARAQITGIMVGSVVWIMVAGLSVPAFALLLLVGVATVAGRNTRAGLWWRFTARRATGFEQRVVLASIVPIASLRGRNQPTIWVGRRLPGVHVVMPSCADLVVSPEFVRQVACGQLTDRQASALVSHTLGQHQVSNSVLVNAGDLYCLPWRIAQMLTGGASQVAGRNPILGFAWKIRWLVFTAAAVDAYRNQRWAALVGVLTIAVLSWSTSHFQSRWAQVLQDLGDRQASAEGLRWDLADLVRRHDRSFTGAERADKLSRGTPKGISASSGCIGRGRATARSVPADRRSYRSSGGRRCKQ